MDALVMCSNSPRVKGKPGAGLPLAIIGGLSDPFITVARELCRRAGNRSWLLSSVTARLFRETKALTRAGRSRSARSISFPTHQSSPCPPPLPRSP